MTYEECLANNTRRHGAEPFYASIGRESPENKCLDTVVLLQTFLGLGVVVGTLGFSCLVVNKSKQCLISPQYLLQISILGIGQLVHCWHDIAGSNLLSEGLAGVNTPLVCVG